MRFLGLDVGTKTLGIAVSDRTNTIAAPLITLHFPNMEFEKVMNDLQKIIEEKNITEFVIGLPKNMDNSLGFATERTKKFAEILKTHFSKPIHFIDERLSSIEAEHILLSTDAKRIKRKQVVDNVAAAIILDTYLKERRIQNERNEKEQ